MAHGPGPATAVAAVWPMDPHPEALPHEVFILNADDELWPRIHWRTKRRGSRAINPVTGGTMEGRFPVFIDRTEIGDRTGEY